MNDFFPYMLGWPERFYAICLNKMLRPEIKKTLGCYNFEAYNDSISILTYWISKKVYYRSSNIGYKPEPAIFF